MAAPAQKARFALDSSNILIDLGEGLPFAHAFLSAYKSKGLAVPPTVVQELVFLSQDSSHRANRFAQIALRNMLSWNIIPYDLISAGHGITEINAKKLMSKNLLPEDELHDGLIIIEAALVCIPILVTSDKHLLKINPRDLTQALAEFDLPAVTIFHPKALLQ